MDPEIIETVGDNVSVFMSYSVEQLIHIGIIVALSLLTFVIAKIVIKIISKMLRKAVKVKNGKLTPLMAGFILKVVQVVIWVFTALIILQIWGINLTPGCRSRLRTSGIDKQYLFRSAAGTQQSLRNRRLCAAGQH